MKNDLNDWKLERFILGELPKREIKAILKRSATDAALRDRIGRLRRSDGEILRSYSAEKTVPQIEKRLISAKAEFREEASSPPRKIIKLAWIPAAVGLFIGIYLVTSRLSDRPESISRKIFDSPDTRIKGAARVNVASAGLHIYRQGQNGIEELHSESVVSTKDLIQLAYTAGPFNYGVIFSIDGRGTVTLHFPEDPGRIPVLQKERIVYLPKAYELDNAPDFERFFFVFSENKIKPSEILERARSLAYDPQRTEAKNLMIPDSQHISILLRKAGQSLK